MPILLTGHSLSTSYGAKRLFQEISFTLCDGDRVGLIGPNGAGKSTLLKILMDYERADSGHVSRRQGLRVGYASQTPDIPALSLEEVLLQQSLPGDAVTLQTRARTLLSRSKFSDFSQDAATLSGGWKKRLDIARALMNEPHLLLLDEPTNHLDLEGIEWLEAFLKNESCAYVVVSHDRYFLENVCNKIIELNPCYPQGLFVREGTMSQFMEDKAAFLEAQTQRERGLKSTVRGEIDWLRRGPKARTTKAQSRIQKAYELIDELSEVKARNVTSQVAIEFSASERETRKLLVAKNIAKTLGMKSLFRGVDITLSPGTRLGLVGKNGTGKTTLMKILAGMIPQDLGTVKYADDLKVVYFDQHREQIPEDTTLRDALSPNGDFVHYNGQSIHVNGWARKFLFPTDRLALPVKYLSGGERARILIAKLMLQPADVLFLDEPTNDLDIPTLEVIEESLKEFPGAVVLITHDRCLMDRVCTQILGLGTGNEQQLFADYLQWERDTPDVVEKEEVAATTPKPRISKPKKLSFQEQKELENMEENILKAEAEVAKLHSKLEGTDEADAQKTLDAYRLLGEAQGRLDALFDRWQQLEQKANPNG